MEVNVLIDGEIITMNAEMVFNARTPMGKHFVAFKEVDSKRGMRLWCRDQDEAERLAQGIRAGGITDLTGYPAEWKTWN